MNKRNIYSRFLIGFKKGIKTSTLPQEIIAFQNNFLIRILRFLGGISLLMLLGRSIIKLEGIYLYLAFTLTLLYIIFHVYIFYQKIKYFRKRLKNGDFDVKKF